MKRVLFSVMFLILSLMCIAQNITYHTVQRGETLYGIAKKYNVTIDAIRSSNPDLEKYFFAGMKLIIPVNQNATINNSMPEKKIIEKGGKNLQQETNKVPFQNNSPLSTRKNLSNNQEFQSRETAIGYSLSVDICGGFSNFIWSGGSPKPGIGFGAGITGQLYIKETNLIPEGYFAELGLGYVKKGSGAFPISYIRTKILPLNYSFTNLSDNFSILVKGGGYFAFPITELKTTQNTFKTNLDYGAFIGVGFAYERYSLLFSYEHGLANVSKSNVELKNQNIFITLAYRFY